MNTLLRATSQRAPLPVVLDDLHAADPSSLMLLTPCAQLEAV
jgi:hypothetical protein